VIVHESKKKSTTKGTKRRMSLFMVAANCFMILPPKGSLKLGKDAGVESLF